MRCGLNWAALRSTGLFVIIGVVTALAVKISDADKFVHLRFALTMGALYLAGAAVEQTVGIRGDAPPSVIHRIVLGQIGFVVYFYLRSPLAHLGLPGVGRVELMLVVAALAVLVGRRMGQRPAKPLHADAVQPPPWLGFLVVGAIWLAWWVSTHRFLAYRSGALQTPSSDPDMHAYLAKLVIMGGKLAYTHAPYSSDPQSYPSAFAVLNAVWAQLSGVPIVKILNCQLTLQACLAVGLIIEAAGAIRRHLALVTSIVLIGIAHWLFYFPTNQESLVLGGTARWAHSALMIFPLTLGLRLAVQSEDPGAQPWRLRLLALVVATFSAAWALVINPSHVIVVLPILVAMTIVVLTGVRRHADSAPTPRRWRWGLVIAAVALPMLIVFSDALVVWTLRGIETGAAGAVNDAETPPLKIGKALKGGYSKLKTASTAGLPHGCVQSNKCQLLVKKARKSAPGLVYVAALGYLGFCLVRWVRARRKKEPAPAVDRLRTGAFAVVALGIAAALVSFLWGFTDKLLAGQRALWAILLQEYSGQGLRVLSAYLFFFVLAVGVSAMALGAARLITRLSRRQGYGVSALADVLIATLLVFGLWRMASKNKNLSKATMSAYRAHVKKYPKTTLGWVRDLDVKFVKQVDRVVPRGERVLLTGVAMRMHQRENWIFSESISRALPLFTDTHFAFFVNQGARIFSADNYMKHVCNSFDVQWLVDNNVKWVILSNDSYARSCIHNWDEIENDYYQEVLRLEDRALYRVREDQLFRAKNDPRLDLPLPAPVNAGPKGESIRGTVELHGPHFVKGWACDFGSSAQVTIELSLTNRDFPNQAYREFHQAGLPRESRIMQACGDKGAHGFLVAPSTVPGGVYYARILAYDGPGKESRVIAQNFFLTVPM